MKGRSGNRSSRFSLADDTGDQAVKELLPFDQPLRKVPICQMVLVVSKVIVQTFIISFSTLGSQIMTAAGYILLNLKKDTEGQADLGISLLYNLAFFYGFFLSMVDKLGIDLSLSFGAKNYEQTKKILNQGALAAILMFCILTLPTFLFSKQLLMLVNIEEDSAQRCFEIIMYMMFSNFVEMIGDFLRNFCMAQGIETIFGFSALFGSVVAVASGYFFIVRWDMGPIGWVYSKTVYEVINLSVAVGACFKTHKKTVGLVSLAVARSGFFRFFWTSVKFALGSYSEFVANEIAGYFVFMTKDEVQIAAFAAILNLSALFYSMGETFAIICRTRMNLLIGKQHHRIAKNFYLFYVLTLGGFGMTVGLMFLVHRNQITNVYANSTQEIADTFKKLLTIYSLCIASELTITSSFMGIKTIGSIGFLLMLNILLFVGANFGLNYYFTQELGYQTEAILITVQALFYLENILCLIKVMMTDWSGLQVEGEAEEKVLKGVDADKRLTLRDGEAEDGRQ